MSNFWDFSVWGTVNLAGALIVSMLIANMVKRSLPFMKNSLIPTSVLGGLLLLVLSIIYADSKVVNDRVYGQLIFKMPADIDDVNKLRKYLELNKVHYKEVDANEFN